MGEAGAEVAYEPVEIVNDIENTGILYWRVPENRFGEGLHRIRVSDAFRPESFGVSSIFAIDSSIRMELGLQPVTFRGWEERYYSARRHDTFSVEWNWRIPPKQVPLVQIEVWQYLDSLDSTGAYDARNASYPLKSLGIIKIGPPADPSRTEEQSSNKIPYCEIGQEQFGSTGLTCTIPEYFPYGLYSFRLQSQTPREDKRRLPRAEAFFYVLPLEFSGLINQGMQSQGGSMRFSIPLPSTYSYGIIPGGDKEKIVGIIKDLGALDRPYITGHAYKITWQSDLAWQAKYWVTLYRSNVTKAFHPLLKADLDDSPLDQYEAALLAEDKSASGVMEQSVDWTVPTDVEAGTYLLVIEAEDNFRSDTLSRTIVIDNSANCEGPCDDLLGIWHGHYVVPYYFDVFDEQRRCRGTWRWEGYISFEKDQAGVILVTAFASTSPLDSRNSSWTPNTYFPEGPTPTLLPGWAEEFATPSPTPAPDDMEGPKGLRRVSNNHGHDRSFTVGHKKLRGRQLNDRSSSSPSIFRLFGWGREQAPRLSLDHHTKLVGGGGGRSGGGGADKWGIGRDSDSIPVVDIDSDSGEEDPRVPEEDLTQDPYAKEHLPEFLALGCTLLSYKGSQARCQTLDFASTELCLNIQLDKGGSLHLLSIQRSCLGESVEGVKPGCYGHLDENHVFAFDGKPEEGDTGGTPSTAQQAGKVVGWTLGSIAGVAVAGIGVWYGLNHFKKMNGRSSDRRPSRPGRNEDSGGDRDRDRDRDRGAPPPRQQKKKNERGSESEMAYFAVASEDDMEPVAAPRRR